MTPVFVSRLSNNDDINSGHNELTKEYEDESLQNGDSDLLRKKQDVRSQAGVDAMDVESVDYQSGVLVDDHDDVSIDYSRGVDMARDGNFRKALKNSPNDKISSDIMVDLGTGNNNKINWALGDKSEMIDIIEIVYRGARKGRGLVVSPKDYSTKYRY